MSYFTHIPKAITNLYNSFLSRFDGVDWVEEARLILTATLLAAIILIPLLSIPQEITERIGDFIIAPFEQLWRVPLRQGHPRPVHRCGPGVEVPDEGGDWSESDGSDSAYDSGYADEWVSDPGF
ncbi:hypothetical protein BU16DRAFT_565512 [Lophium mytilinum]|uniref:Uncharacterized protein n=1 Tax=Lophium mytilinum TaxID=390894 RepID=A0A6A6QID9_9PEZI|nr:hypothetical protein BU16DRAFT_565512 [Lophium mytilinum]